MSTCLPYVQAESRCCASTACGYVAQNLLLTRGQLHHSISALCQLTLQKVASVRSTPSKNSSCSPFEIDICWKKVSTSSCSVSMSLIFLAIMDNLPHPRVHLAESDHKSNSKLCSCILKTVQTTCTNMTCYTFKHCATLSIIQKLCEL